jgi:Mg2+ and Co2+ transporter CorA
MSDEEIGPRHTSSSWMMRTIYVRSPTMHEDEDGDAREPTLRHTMEGDWEVDGEDLAADADLRGPDLLENAADGVIADAFNAEAAEDPFAPSQYLPGVPTEQYSQSPSTEVHVSGHKVLKGRKITLKMVSADHIWSIRQEDEHRVVLRVLKTLEDIQTEYTDVIDQQQAHVLQRSRRESSKGSSRHSSKSGNSRSSRSSDKKKKLSSREPNSPNTGKRGKAGADDGTSADSSASLANSSEDPTSVGWIDVQSTDGDLILRVCELFHLHSSTVGSIIDEDSAENVEHYHSLGYFFINVVVPTLHRKKGGVQSSSLREGERSSSLSCIVLRNLVISIHRKPFPGLLETVREVKSRFALRHRRIEHQPSDNRSNISRSERVYSMMTVGWVLSKLVSNVVFSSIPDPTVLLQQLAQLDETAVYLASQGSMEDQREVLQNISKFRRKLVKERNDVLSKEQFLTTLLAPACRTTYLTRRAADAELLKQALAFASRTATRLEGAQESLNSAQSNLLSVLTLSQHRAAHQTDLQVQLLGVVTVISIAPTFIATSMGMNISVPFMAVNGNPSLAPFFAIVGIIGAWFFWFGIFQLRGRMAQLCGF